MGIRGYATTTGEDERTTGQFTERSRRRLPSTSTAPKARLAEIRHKWRQH